MEMRQKTIFFSTKNVIFSNSPIFHFEKITRFSQCKSGKTETKGMEVKNNNAYVKTQRVLNQFLVCRMYGLAVIMVVLTSTTNRNIDKTCYWTLDFRLAY